VKQEGTARNNLFSLIQTSYIYVLVASNKWFATLRRSPIQNVFVPTEVNMKTPLILGRPFLSTPNAHIDTGAGKFNQTSIDKRRSLVKVVFLEVTHL